MEYERRVLIVDGPDGELQPMAMALLRSAYDVHYANDLAEAQLLAREHHQNVGGVLLSSAIDVGRIPDLIARLGVAPAALVPTGEAPPRREIAALRHHGVRWHLWGEPEEDAVRFVLGAVLSEQDDLDLRFYLRVPSRLPGRLEAGSAKTDVTLCDLSLGGACVMGGAALQEGDATRLHFTVAESELDLPARVAWTTGDSGDGVAVAGLGFTEVDPDSGRAIDAFVDSIVDRQRIRVPAED